jgi:hypothetical protein
MEEATMTIFAMMTSLYFLAIDLLLLCTLAHSAVLPMDRQLVPFAWTLIH